MPDICETIKSYIKDEMHDYEKYLQFAETFNNPAIKGAITMIGNQEKTHHDYYVSLYKSLHCDSGMM